MKFKHTENNIIWESHYNGEFSSDEEGFNHHDEFGDDDDFDDEIVISSEPMGDMDIDHEDSFDDEENEDNKIVLHTIRKIVKRGEALLDLCKDCQLDPWMIAKIVKAEDYITDVWDQLEDGEDVDVTKFDSHSVSL